MSVCAKRFSLASGWKLLVEDMGLDPASVLAFARLPGDLFNRESILLTPAEYFRFWKGVEQAADDQEVALLIAEHLKADVFDPPLFACLCSPDFSIAVQRLQQYKPLIGPMILAIDQGTSATCLTVECYGYEEPLPRTLEASEMVFFTQILRLATRFNVSPLAVTLTNLPENLPLYEAYFGCKVEVGSAVSISFSKADMARPFVSFHASMWEFFEGKLNQKLADLGSDAGTADRVRAVLLEALPAGDSSIEYVAGKLAMSKRTLQRKLTLEDISYQTLLTQVRADLADYYLEKSHMSLGEISFLLGFKEANSFIRAYRSWKGFSPGQFRQRLA